MINLNQIELKKIFFKETFHIKKIQVTTVLLVFRTASAAAHYVCIFTKFPSCK